MVSLADSLVSATARRLALRKRPDLVAERHRYQGQVYWVVKDPLGLNYFRFQEEEYAILQMLDGQTSLDELKRQFEAQFPPQKITLDELQQFIGTLHRSGLIIADVPGQGRQLRRRRDERKRKEWLSLVTNILSIRFKGIDPERLLIWMLPYFRWLYRPWAVAAWALLALSALLLVGVQFDVFQSKLPAFHQFFTIKNAFLLSVALAVTKVIHEFGHGLTCKHFGGECHEMGVMLLVLTPCLYCNVSDSWMLPNKWHRAAIGAAGMYVEVLIASICTFVWWFSEPGLLNHLALSTMFVCSVSTLLFNGNPLLRYDGYYILADILEIPNLRQKATDILNRKLGEWCLGLERPEDPFLPQRNQWVFALYSIAAVIYRWFVTFSILYFLYKVFEPYRLEVIGQLIAMTSLVGLVGVPAYNVGKFFWIPGRIEKVKKPRMYATLAVLAAVVLAIVYVPLPYRVVAPFEIHPREPAHVYVHVPGRLEEVLVDEGQRVEPGQVLARLSNLDLEVEVARYQGQLEQFDEELRGLERMRHSDAATASVQIDSVKKTRAATAQMLVEKRQDLEQLVLKAERAGTVLPAPEKPHRPDPNQQLVGWTGSALAQENRGAFLADGELFCLIGEPTKMEALLVIDQADRVFISEGQKVELQLEEQPFEPLWSTLEQISTRPLTESPRHLSNKAGGQLPTETDPSGIERPMSTSYPARVFLDNPDGLLRIGLTGQAKVHAGYRTLGQRLWRFVTQTFNFKL